MSNALRVNTGVEIMNEGSLNPTATDSGLRVEVGGGNATYYTCPKCHVVSHNPHDVRNLYCGRCLVSAEQLRDEPVTIFAHLTSTCLTHRDCFSLAALTLLDNPQNPDARLVHGWILSSFEPGEHIEHAWCEFPAEAEYTDDSIQPIIVVVDYSQLDERAVILPAPDLYRVWQARDIRRFCRAELIANVLRYGLDGPWPIQPPENPHDIERDGKAVQHRGGRHAGHSGSRRRTR